MKKKYVFLFVPCVALALSGCGQRSSTGAQTSAGTVSPQNPPNSLAPSSAQNPQPPLSSPVASSTQAVVPGNRVSRSAPTAQTPRMVTIYTVNTSNGKDSNDYLVAQQVPITQAQDPAREAVDALLSAPGTPIAPGTRLLGINIHHGAADVDFSRVPVDQDQGEESQEQALAALQKTLGQFPDIQTIHVLVNGKAPSALGEAAGGNLAAIRPNQAAGDSQGI